MAKKPTTSGDRPPNHHAKQHNPVAAAPIDNLEQEQRPRRAVSPDLPGKLATHGLTLATAINAFATDADKQEAQNVEAELASNGAFISDTIVEGLRNDNLRIGGLKKDDSGKRIWKKAISADLSIQDYLRDSHGENPEITEILAQGMKSALQSGELVAYGRINGTPFPTPIPTSEWLNDWWFIKEIDSAILSTPPNKIEDVRILRAADATIDKNSRGAGAKQHRDWPQLMHEFIKKMMKEARYPVSASEAYEWIQKAARDSDGELHEFEDKAIKEHIIRTFGQDFFDSLK